MLTWKSTIAAIICICMFLAIIAGAAIHKESTRCYDSDGRVVFEETIYRHVFSQDTMTRAIQLAEQPEYNRVYIHASYFYGDRWCFAG